MRLGLLVCSAVLWLASGAALAEASFEGVTLKLELDPGQARLEGRFEADPARIDPAALRRFRLDPGIAVDAVTLGGQAVEFERSEDGWLELAREPAADAGPLAIRYGARLSAPDQARPGSGYLGPAGGYLPPGADWYPRRPDAEPHAVRIELKSLDGHLGIASGSRVAEERRGDEYHATFDHPAGRALAVATGPWEAAARRVGDVEVRTLFPAGLEQQFGETYREQAAEYLQRFSDEIGPYPFATFTIAASPQPVGLAFSGFTLLGERVIPLPFIPYTSLGHEVLHAWWGTGVYVDYSGGNWSEGMTTYMADYQFKRERGEGREERGQWLRDYAALPAGEDRAHGRFRGGSSGADRIAGYHRGAMLWRMLEDRIGREALLTGAQALYDEWRFLEADWNAVIGAFDDATDEDLRPFFAQWVERAGAPALELTDLRREAWEDGWRVQGRLRQSDKQNPWDLYVPLDLETEDGRETHWIELAAGEKAIALDVSSRPLAIAIDPDWRMFRHLAADESPAILRQAALDPQARVVVLGDAEPAEVAPWLGRVPGTADDLEDTRIVLGSHSAVAEWLEARDLPGDPTSLADAADGPEIGSGARAWTVPESGLVVISGADASARREAAAALRHRSHYSFLFPGPNGDWRTGLWPQPGVWREFADDE